MTEFSNSEVKSDSSIRKGIADEGRARTAFLAFTGSEGVQETIANPEPKKSLNKDNILTKDLVVALLGIEGIDLVFTPDGKLNIVLDLKELGGIEELLRSLIIENRRLKKELISDRGNKDTNLRHLESLEKQLRDVIAENEKLRTENQGLRAIISAIEEILNRPPSAEGQVLISDQKKEKKPIPVLGQDTPTLNKLTKDLEDKEDREKQSALVGHDIYLDGLLGEWLESLDRSSIRRISQEEFENIKRENPNLILVRLNVLKEDQPHYPMYRVTPDLDTLRRKEAVIIGFQEGRIPPIYLIENEGSYDYYFALPTNS